MKPEVDQILALSAGQLIGSLVPQLPAGFAQGSASLLGIMMMLAAQEYDRAAEIRAAENADMRALFRASAQAVAEPELRSTLERAAGAAEGSLKVSALNAVNAALRGHLIRLHAYAEENALRDLDRQIWTVLKASAERRILKLP